MTHSDMGNTNILTKMLKVLCFQHTLSIIYPWIQTELQDFFLLSLANPKKVSMHSTLLCFKLIYDIITLNHELRLF